MINSDADAVVGRFGPETWIFVGSAGAAVLGSTYFAVVALWSRQWRSRPRQRLAGPKNEVVWHFGAIAVEASQTAYVDKLLRMEVDDEVEALAHQIHVLSKNVRKKHTALRRSFALFAAAPRWSWRDCAANWFGWREPAVPAVRVVRPVRAEPVARAPGSRMRSASDAGQEGGGRCVQLAGVGGDRGDVAVGSHDHRATGRQGAG